MEPKNYINQKIISGFENKKGPFKYTKLIAFLKSLNKNYAEKDPYACAPIIRAILDTTPSLLGYRTFDEVAHNYSWAPSHKKYMEKLLDFRNEGDDTLHTLLSEKESYLDMDDLPTPIRLNTLLEEYLTKGGKSLPSKPIRTETKAKILFEIKKQEFIRWANFSMGFNMAYSFRVALLVNNFNNNRSDYISAKLVGETETDKWESQNFTLQSPLKDSPNKPLEIESNKIQETVVFLSVELPQHNRFYLGVPKMPIFKADTVFLIITTASGIEQPLPISIELIKDG